ncbi:uncharacterized protein LOC123292792 [Chrysoperla carnea]|uniref:uncharacterized protein LOC123292792 n=1 Tax=Chrysoperla carnea TaxID=189513 RepID=UPI001D0828D5|nr:uncharacterized protein LOC123292792 [Chrysoperla carnea]
MRPDSIELVSIAVDIHGEKHLKKIHIRHEIQKIIDDLIKEYDLDGTAIEYGLRLTHARNKKIATRYVTDTNKSTLIQDGCELKLVEAPKLHLEFIFKKIFSKDQRESGYDLLNHQLHDDYLLQIIHEVGWDTDICNKIDFC